MVDVLVLERSHQVSLETLVLSIAEQNGVRREILPDDRLVDCGLTSLALVELMLAIEANYSVAIPDTELRSGNFESITAIQQMLGRLPMAR